MARKDQGNSLLTLKPTTGAVFTRQRVGFDTGTRVFHCDESVADRLTPLLGAADSVHRAMFIDAVTRTEMENGVVQFTVQYLGLLDRRRKKPAEEEISGEARFLSEVPTGAAVQPITFIQPVPIVSRIYVTSTRPTVLDIGRNITPPGYKRVLRPRAYYTVFRSDQVTYFEGWILRNRTYRPAGNLYEVTDTFAYEQLTLPTGA